MFRNTIQFPNAFLCMREISRQCYMQPKAAETKMRKSFNATMKYQNKLWTKTLLERLLDKNIGTNEVVNFALNLFKNSRSKKVSMFERTINENMNKLSSAQISLRSVSSAQL